MDRQAAGVPPTLSGASTASSSQHRASLDEAASTSSSAQDDPAFFDGPKFCFMDEGSVSGFRFITVLNEFRAVD